MQTTEQPVIWCFPLWYIAICDEVTDTSDAQHALQWAIARKFAMDFQTEIYFEILKQKKGYISPTGKLTYTGRKRLAKAIKAANRNKRRTLNASKPA